jgi:outer membrane protein assembly factor BamB
VSVGNFSGTTVPHSFAPYFLKINNPLIAGDLVFFSSLASQGALSLSSIHAVNLSTGEEVWNQTLNGAVMGTMSFVDDMLLVPAWDGFFYVFGV